MYKTFHDTFKVNNNNSLRVDTLLVITETILCVRTDSLFAPGSLVCSLGTVVPDDISLLLVVLTGVLRVSEVTLRGHTFVTVGGAGDYPFPVSRAGRITRRPGGARRRVSGAVSERRPPKDRRTVRRPTPPVSVSVTAPERVCAACRANSPPPDGHSLLSPRNTLSAVQILLLAS